MVVLVLALLAGGFYVAGSLVSREHENRVSVLINKPPVEVFARIDAVEAYPAWRTGTTAARRLNSEAGVECFEEHTSFGPVQYDVILRRAPTSRVTRIVDGGGFGGTWTFGLESVAAGTRITITEKGYIGSPPFRLLGKFVFGYDRTLREYLADLQAATQD